jgi:hypothetical protein
MGDGPKEKFANPDKLHFELRQDAQITRLGPATAPRDCGVGQELKLRAHLREAAISNLPLQQGKVLGMKIDFYSLPGAQPLHDLAHQLVHRKITRFQPLVYKTGSDGHGQLDRGLLHLPQPLVLLGLHLPGRIGHAHQDALNGFPLFRGSMGRVLLRRTGLISRGGGYGRERAVRIGQDGLPQRKSEVNVNLVRHGFVPGDLHSTRHNWPEMATARWNALPRG